MKGDSSFGATSKTILRLSLGLLMVSNSASASSPPITVCDTDPKYKNQVFEASAQGSTRAWLRVLGSLDCLDGGDLEDAHISLGIGLFAQPGKLGPQLTDYGRFSVADMVAMSTMLPAAFVDLPCEQENELTRRKKIITENRLFGLRSPLVLQAVAAAANASAKWCAGR